MTNYSIASKLEPLALNRREAANLLGISERTLATLTRENKVPFKRINRRVIYPYDLLRAYVNGTWNSN